MPFRAVLLQLELGKDRLRLRIARLRTPLRAQPFVEPLEPVVRVEDAPHDELRRHGPVPVILLQAEGDVVPPDTPVAVHLRSLAERDSAARIAAVTVHSETEMLAVSNRRKVAELAPGCEQRHVGIAEPERRQPAQLLAQIERQLR